MDAFAPALQFASSHDQLERGDYVSPNFQVIRVDKCFPQKTIGDMEGVQNPLFRKQYAHRWYVDPDFPECGFLTRDEAHILYNAALLFPGLNALEIGSHVGWSTVHFGLGGVKLDAVEPQLSYDPRVLLALVGSIRSAGIDKTTTLHAGFSPQKVEELANGPFKKRWSLIFIDGNHNGHHPYQDAVTCAQYATEDAMVFFHDVVFPDVARGLLYFREQQWHTALYHTQQIMGVAWRGNVTPPYHIPDPIFQWSLPAHLLPYYNDDGSSK